MKDICIRESYKDKVSWNKIGILIDGKEGKQYIKLYHLPGVLINVFDQKKKENNGTQNVPEDWAT